MQFCKECGLLVPQGATHCPQCGAPVPPEAPGAQPPHNGPLYGTAAPQPQPPQQPQAPTAPAAPEDDLPLGGFVLSMLLMEIPILGGILQLVWAFGGTKNATRRKLAAATLIKAGVNLLLGLLLAAMAAALVWAVYTTVGMTPPQYYTW